MDRTKDLETWNEGITYQKLSYIADVCNQFLLPHVLCPWGCSIFFVTSDMVIWILLYNDSFKNATFLLLMPKNDLK